MGWVWAALTWLLRFQRMRPAVGTPPPDWSGQMRGRSFRTGEWLRDRLRPGWLRVRRRDADAGSGPSE